MQGHWIGGTRKLNKHWQSGIGEEEEQLILFDVPEDDPVKASTANHFTIGSGNVFMNGGVWGTHLYTLKLKQRKYQVKWNIHDASNGRFFGIEGICANTGITGISPINNVGFVAGSNSDRPRPIITTGPDGITDFDSPDVTITWLSPYYSYNTTLGTIHYKYTENSNNLVTPDVIFDFTNTTKETLRRTDVVTVTFVGNFNNLYSGNVLWGKMWLEPIP